MPVIRYILHDGSEHEVHAESGLSVMQAAVDNMIDGIVGECGGTCSCGTCHCYVETDWADKIGNANNLEQDMIQFLDEADTNSRLSCQITITDELDGLVVKLPKSQ